MKFRKKPIVVDAMLWPRIRSTDSQITARAKPVRDWVGPAMSDYWEDGWLFGRIQTPEGTMLADPGDWIIRDVKGEFYPCKPGIFEATYEPVIQ